jgi:hypothetical protein
MYEGGAGKRMIDEDLGSLSGNHNGRKQKGCLMSKQLDPCNYRSNLRLI